MAISSRQKVSRPTLFPVHFYACSWWAPSLFTFIHVQGGNALLPLLKNFLLKYLLIHSFVARLRGAVEVLCETDRREDIERQTVSL